jgi:transposase InsO family protein
VLGQHRSTRRKIPRGRADEDALTADIIALASRYGRYGCRRITALLWAAGWTVNVRRVERSRRREGLRVPSRRPKRGRLWPNDGSCVRLRLERPNHVWSYDVVESRTHDEGRSRCSTRSTSSAGSAWRSGSARQLNSTDVIDVLADQFILRGMPAHIRSDNGPEFVATAVRTWIAAVGARTAYIEPGSPWENGCRESFGFKLRDELLNGEIFYSLAEARAVSEGWRRHRNTKRPHSSPGCRPPAPEVFERPASPSRAAPPATPAVAPRPVMHQA